jgi:cell division transport system permease protein
MNAWLRQHARAMKQGARRIGALNVLVIGVALALPAGGYAMLESLRALAGRVQLDPQVTLFLAPEAGRTEADSLNQRLRALSGVGAVRFIPREEALKDLSSVQGLPELIAALGKRKRSPRSSASSRAWRRCRPTRRGPGGWPRSAASPRP